MPICWRANTNLAKKWLKICQRTLFITTKDLIVINTSAGVPLKSFKETIGLEDALPDFTLFPFGKYPVILPYSDMRDSRTKLT